MVILDGICDPKTKADNISLKRLHGIVFIALVNLYSAEFSFWLVGSEFWFGIYFPSTETCAISEVDSDAKFKRPVFQVEYKIVYNEK